MVSQKLRERVRSFWMQGIKPSKQISERMGGILSAQSVAAIIATDPLIQALKRKISSGPEEGMMSHENIEAIEAEETTEAREIEEAIGATFHLERDLEEALEANIGQLEDGLTIEKRQQVVPSGRIDLLASDKNGVRVVIELKAGTADGNALAQILAYMGDVSDNNTTHVRGILVARDFMPRVIAASKAIPTCPVELKKYLFAFTFETLG